MKLARFYEGTKLDDGTYSYVVELTGSYIQEDYFDGSNDLYEPELSIVDTKEITNEVKQQSEDFGKYLNLKYVKSAKLKDVVDKNGEFVTQIQVLTDHELSAEESNKVLDAVESQASDGWGENGFDISIPDYYDDYYDDDDDDEDEEIYCLTYYPWSNKTKASII